MNTEVTDANIEMAVWFDSHRDRNPQNVSDFIIGSICCTFFVMVSFQLESVVFELFLSGRGFSTVDSRNIHDQFS